MAIRKSLAQPIAVGDHDQDQDDRGLLHMSEEVATDPSIPPVFHSWQAHLRIQILDDSAGEDGQSHGSQVAGDASQGKILTQNNPAGSSGRVGEDEYGYELSDLKGNGPISEQHGISVTEIVEHSAVTEIVEHSAVTDDRFCRICGPDEAPDDPNNFLVALGCHCKGPLGMMHRKCALEWFGPRIYVDQEHRCELCKASVDNSLRALTLGAFFNEDSSREVLVRAVSTYGTSTSPDAAPAPAISLSTIFRHIRNAIRVIIRTEDWKCGGTTLSVIVVVALLVIMVEVLLALYEPYLHHPGSH